MKLDVIFYFLKYTVFRSIFRILLQDIEEQEDKDKKENAAETLKDITSNTRKHSLILYLSIIFTTVVYFDMKNFSREEVMLLLTVILPLTAVMGVSWFVVTFGAIPARFLGVAINLTFAMCLAFVACLFIMGLTLFVVLPLGTAIVTNVIILSVYVSSVLYDTMDLLKSGIDEKALKFYTSANKRISKLDGENSNSIL